MFEQKYHSHSPMFTVPFQAFQSIEFRVFIILSECLPLSMASSVESSSHANHFSLSSDVENLNRLWNERRKKNLALNDFSNLKPCRNKLFGVTEKLLHCI